MSSAADPPVNQAQQATAGLVLHVLQGPNTGAELRLDDGIWLIGTGLTADLTFADPDLAEEHLRITVDGPTVSIHALAEGVRLDGTPLTLGAEEVLPLRQPVWVGRTAFAVGPHGSAWPDPAAAPPVVASLPTSPPSDTRPNQTPSASGLRAQPPTSSAPHRLMSRWYVWGAVATGCILLLLVATFWMLDGASPTPRQPAAETTDPLHSVQNLIHGLGLQASVTAARTSNGIAVTGLVPSSQEQNALTDAFREAGLVVTSNVITATSLHDMVVTVLHGYAVDANVAIAPDGSIQLDGYAPSRAARTAAIKELRQDIPQIRKLNDVIVTPDGAQAELESTVRDLGLGGLSVTSAPHLVIVSGAVAPNYMEAWNGAATTFRQRNSDRIVLVTRIIPVTAATPRGIRLGQSPYLVMLDGKRLGIGDTLGSLGRIIMIFSDRVRVRTSQGDVDVRYTQPPRWIMEDNNAAAR